MIFKKILGLFIGISIITIISTFIFKFYDSKREISLDDSNKDKLIEYLKKITDENESNQKNEIKLNNEQDEEEKENLV